MKHQSPNNGKVGVYCRISKDDEEQGLGVARQEADGRRDLAARGLEPARVFVDNDVSGSGEKERPAYEDMLDALRTGAIGAVWVWDVDRAQRGLREFVEFVDVCEQVGARVLWTGGEANFATGEGIMELEFKALMARAELRKLRGRVQRKAEELRSNGHWRGGPPPYGYRYADEPDSRGKLQLELEPKEASVLREAARRSLAGETLGRICVDFERREIKGKTGQPFSPAVLGRSLASAAISGRIEHEGEVVGPARWEPIISPTESDMLRRGRRSHAVKVQRRGHLLAGLVFCGRCGSPLLTGTRDGRRVLSCRNRFNGRGHGCGGVTVSEEPVEQLVVQDVVRKADAGELNALLYGARTDELEAAERDLAEIGEQLHDLAHRRVKERLTPEEVAGEREALLEERARLSGILESAQRKLAVPAPPSPLAGKWERLDLVQQRGVLRTVLQSITIRPSSRRGRAFDKDRIALEWRV